MPIFRNCAGEEEVRPATGKEEIVATTQLPDMDQPIVRRRRRPARRWFEFHLPKISISTLIIGATLLNMVPWFISFTVEASRSQIKPIASISGRIGHQDGEGRDETIVMAQNTGTQVVLFELPGGNSDQTRKIDSVELIGKNQAYWQPRLEWRQLNLEVDQHQDLVLTINGQERYFLNLNGEFKQVDGGNLQQKPARREVGLNLVQSASAAEAPKPQATRIPTSVEKVTFRPVEEGKPLSVLGPPSITAQKIKEVLHSYGSPAEDEYQYIFDMGVSYYIDPAIALAFFAHESGCGTEGRAVGNRSFGNIVRSPHIKNAKLDDDGFNRYDSWKEAIKDYYNVILHGYVLRGAKTVEEIIPSYAPKGHKGNNPPAYIKSVRDMTAKWRNESR